jgi:ATP phosphoribosyltransferase
MTVRKVKIAVPNKGRLLEPVLKLLEDIGLSFERKDRSLISNCSNFNCEIVYIRAGDIPEYVQDKVVDLGITGRDLVLEKKARVDIIQALEFGKGSIVIAIPEHSVRIKAVEDLAGMNIATSYDVIASSFFKKKGINANIIRVEGATEITSRLNLSDAIVDIVSSGTTLKMNNLKPLETIIETEAVLIANKDNVKFHTDSVQKFITIVDSVITARNKRYIMMNAPKSKLENIKNVAPGLSSPTIMQLADENMIAIHSVVDEAHIWEIITKLKKIGATGILVMPIEKISF